MKLQTCILASVTLLLAIATGPLFARTWTDLKRRTVDADFVKFVDGNVTIKRHSDGKLFSVPLATLSEADQSFIKAQAALAVSTEPKSKSTDSTKDEAVNKEMKRLLGTWIFDHGRSPDGWTTTVQGLDLRLIIQAGGFRQTRLGEGSEGKLVIDPTQAPKTIDVMYSPKDKKAYTLHGIYDLVNGADGEALVIAFGEPDQARPKDLKKSTIDVYFR